VHENVPKLLRLDCQSLTGRIKLQTKNIMISADYLRCIAAWSRGLSQHEIDRARAGIVETTFKAHQVICLRGACFEYWTGVVAGLVKLGTVSKDGKAITFTGVTAGAWFGEGAVLKNEPRRYDLVALRDARLAMMERGTFLWLFENSVAFNRFLVEQLNERLGQFVALLEHDRMLNPTARLARCLASLFNPVLYPDATRNLEITQEEIGWLSGMSRQNANYCLNALEKEGLLELGYGDITIIDLERLRSYGEQANRIRRCLEDGRMMRDMYLLYAKKLSESKGAWDLLSVVATIPADDAFRPLSESEYPLVKK
jgi:CRP-like cAMP-binding protein